MEYCLHIKRNLCDDKSIVGLQTWRDVTNHLRNKLDQWTIGVHIKKFSSDGKLLGERYVTMGNLVNVSLSLRDKQVLKTKD